MPFASDAGAPVEKQGDDLLMACPCGHMKRGSVPAARFDVGSPVDE